MNIFTKTALGRSLLALAFGATLAASAHFPACAQIMGGPGPLGSAGKSSRSANAPEKQPLPAPDAIPGARSREPAAPAARPAGDMQPTDALFDAINRGDIASARDALNRGADLNGFNILGMTPMELSVDLGRNDISFLLLSMRGEDSNRGSRAIGRDAPASAPAGKTAQTGKTAQADKPGSTGRAASNKATQPGNTPVATKPVATPKLFANDGGTPLPNRGFLGFDSRSAAPN